MKNFVKWRKPEGTRIKLMVLLVLASLWLLVAFFADKLVPHDPYAQKLSLALTPPNEIYWLGTDQYGRCLFSRVLMGARSTIFSALATVSITTVVGTAIGVLCGYLGGKIDSFMMRVSDIFLAFPGMVFAIAVAGTLGGGISSAVIAIAAISWPKYTRILRGQVLTIKSSLYMEAARMSGCKPIKSILIHVLPNAIGPIIVTAALDIGVMMMELAGLSFLGLGAMPPIAEWGSMMSNTRSMLQSSTWVVLAPGVAIFLTVMLFNFLGDTIRDVLDPKQI